MSSATLGLKELHQLRLQLDIRQQKLSQGPRQIEAKKKSIDSKKKEIDAQKAKVTDHQKQADQINLQVRTNEHKLSELRLRLNQAASNKEFDITRNQIDKDTAANVVLEDQYLGLLEVVDRAKAQLAQLHADVVDAEAAVKAMTAKFAEEAPALEQQAAELLAEIKVAEQCIPGSLREDYRRLVEAYGADSIAVVEGGACTCCFEELSPQLRVEVRMGKVVRCRSCGRLVYIDGEDA